VPDRLTERFTALADDVARLARTIPTPAVRARGERRQRTRLLLGASTVAGVMVVVAGLIAVSLSPAPEPTPQPLSTPDGTFADTIPADLRMVHEGEDGWIRTDDPLEPSAYNPCNEPDPTLVGRADAVTNRGPDVPTANPRRVSEQVLLFHDPTDATVAILALNGATKRCGWTGGLENGARFGALTLATYLPPTAGGPVPTMPYVLVTQRVNALIVLVGRVTDGFFLEIEKYTQFPELAGEVCAKMHLCGPEACGTALPSPVRSDTAVICESPLPSGGAYPTAPERRPVRDP
jgi:hypothetical protein